MMVIFFPGQRDGAVVAVLRYRAWVSIVSTDLPEELMLTAYSLLEPTLKLHFCNHIYAPT